MTHNLMKQQIHTGIFQSAVHFTVTWLGFDYINYIPNYQKLSILDLGDDRGAQDDPAATVRLPHYMGPGDITQRRRHFSLLKKRRQARLTDVTEGSKGQGNLMVLHTRAVDFSKKWKVKIPLT